MKVGVCIFFTQTSIGPAELARALEERGFESLWVPEHTHIPLDTQERTLGGSRLPPEYWQAYDPFVALTAAATVSSRLVLGTGVLLMGQRDPIGTAKQVATLDQLARGRLLVGVGAGWNSRELAHHGVDFASRWEVLRERVLAMKALWTQDPAAFQGEHVNFGPSRAFPKPLQKPHPPVLLGGHGPRALERVCDYCEGWLPIQGRAELVADCPITVYKAEPTRANLERLEAQGVERVVFLLPSAGTDAVLQDLDTWASDFPL